MKGVGKSKEDLVEDVRFIFAECARLADVAKTGLRNIPRDDAFCMLPHPKAGHVTCGRAAQQRLNALAEESGRRSGLLRRVQVDTLSRHLGEVLVRRFVVERRPFNIKQVDRALSAAARRSESDCADVTHFLPCHLMRSKEPELIELGPVTFHNRRAFRKLMLRKLQAHSFPDEPDRRRHTRQLLAEAIRHYRGFGWVAEVEIKRCDAETSAKLANDAITSALDCLHLILGFRWTDRMSVGGPAGLHERRAGLTISSSGVLCGSTTVTLVGQVNFADGWSVRLSDLDMRRPLELCAVALEAAVDPDLERPLSRRFLDAAQWFGEASRDTSYSTRVVKYVTALERMVMTEERGDIAAVVSERVAALCFDDREPLDREKLTSEAKEVYDLRSRLVHGEMSPKSPRLWRGVRLGAELGEATLLCAISAFGERGLRDDTYRTRPLAAWYARVVEAADARTLEVTRGLSGIPSETQIALLGSTGERSNR